MNEKIESVFVDVTEIGDWVFRTSISNNTNIMIYTQKRGHHNSFMIRFFVDPLVAKEWVEEVVEGKHQDFPD